MTAKIIVIATLALTAAIHSGADEKQAPQTHAEALGFPAGKKVLILHADDAGMCEAANIATKRLLEKGQIQSAATMMPCPKAENFVKWAIKHPEADVGIHLTLTSEWKEYRWGPLSNPDEVPGLIDPEGKFWPSVAEVVEHATPAEVEKEIRAQIDHAIAMGYQPTHIDTHMGTLYGHVDFTEVFFRISEEYNIPANVMELSDPQVVAAYQALGYPIDERTINLVNQYSLPKVDTFGYIDGASSYEEKREKFKAQLRGLKPGLTEIVFHPSVDTELLRSLTSVWEQRIWEDQLFSDPEVLAVIEEEGIEFTTWREIMKRFGGKR